ncbi:MAG: O-antigen ligase family protein [Anaerolineae bacterium]|nr:O-antigen ligase family protein [Anaerolineae bacterium]
MPQSQFTHDSLGLQHIHADKKNLLLVVFVLLHIPLGLLLFYFPNLGILQAGLVFFVGIRAVMHAKRNDVMVVWTLGYLIGGEVLWRLLSLSPIVPHEGGKYIAIAIATLGIMRRYKRIREWPLLPFLMFLFLLPSTVMLLGTIDIIYARKEVLGALTGPIALVLCSMYFMNLKLDHQEVKHLAVCIIAPIVSIGAIAAYNTWQSNQAGTLYFGAGSIKTTSGGFGPNQVSNTLALGAMVCWAMLITLRMRFIENLFFLFIIIGLTIQILLTFSRGGAIVLGLCIASTLITQILNFDKKESVHSKVFLWASFFAFIFLLILWPRIEDFTEGGLTRRYTSEDTERVRIISAELEIWRDYPLLGIGPGRTILFIGNYTPQVNHSHTEFSRLLSEHGIFGLLIILLLIKGAITNYSRQATVLSRIWAVSFIVYSFLYMTQAATRTVAPSIIYALIWTDWFWTEKISVEIEEESALSRRLVLWIDQH